MGLFLLIHLMLIYHWFWIGLDWIVSQQQEQEQDIHIYLSLLVYKFHFFFFCHFVLVGYCFLISLGSGSFSILGFFLANWGLCLSFCLFGANCSRVWRRERERVIGEIFWFSVLWWTHLGLVWWSWNSEGIFFFSCSLVVSGFSFMITAIGRVD